MSTQPVPPVDGTSDAERERIVRLTLRTLSAHAITVDSFAFDIDREPEQEPGRGRDIQVGTGKIRDVSFTKRPDAASAYLMKASLSGIEVGTVEITIARPGDDFDNAAEVGRELFDFEGCRISAFGTRRVGGVSVERFSLRFERFAYSFVPAGLLTRERTGWDVVKNTYWDG